MYRYVRVSLCFCCHSPFSLLKVVRDEFTRGGGVGGSRFIRTLRFSTSQGDNYLPYKEKVVNRCTEVEIINVLQLGKRERAFNLLLDLASKTRSVKVENFGYILNYCARTPDPLFALETWKLMEENKMEVNERCWTHIIEALSSGGYLNEAFNFLLTLGETDRSTTRMYNSYINGCVQSKNLAQANCCLQLMEDHYIGKSEVTYLLLLKFAEQKSDKSLMHDIWKEFNKFYEPDIKCLRKFVCSFSKLRDFQSACNALTQMIALASQENAGTGLSTSRRYRSRLDVPIPPKNELACNAIVAKEDVYSEPEESAVKVVSYLLQDDLTSSMENEAFNLNGEGLPLNGLSSPRTGDITCTGTNGINLKETTDYRNLCRSTVYNAIERRVMMVLRSSFNTLIYECGKSGEYLLANKLFLQMQDLGIEPSARTYDGLIQAAISKKGVEYGTEMLKEMKKRNLKPRDTTLAALSIGYSKALDINLAETFIDEISVVYRKLSPFNALLSSCNVLDKPERAVQFLAKMKEMNVKPDIKTYELLFCLFCYVNAPYEEGDIASRETLRKRVHLIEMDMFKNGVEHNSFTLENLIRGIGIEGMTEELLQYLSVAENMFTSTYPGTITYNVVLHALVHARDSNAAFNIFKKMITNEVPLDAATYNIMIDCCSVSNSFNAANAANALLSLMLRNGFTPAACTYTSLLKILISNQQYDKALELFERNFDEKLEADTLVFNTILEKASEKGHLDVTEFFVEQMHRSKIQPDSATCYHAYAAYIYHGLHDTAMEALQVLSMRMISEDSNVLRETRARYEYLIHSENPEVETWITKIFFVANENLGAALLNLRWCAIFGHIVSWSPEDSAWAKRLSANYYSWKQTH